MPAHPADSAIYRKLFSDDEIARLFSDTAEVRAMLLVLGALAKVQGEMGIIPETSARAIHRATMELQIDPSALADGVARSAVPVPALNDLFKSAMQAPEHARFLHWGATSQDIMDTALTLRLRQALALIETRLDTALTALATLAETHAETPMLARTYGQAAVPTSFGAVAAEWGRPLLALRRDLDAVRATVLMVQLGGAAGTMSALDHGAEVRAELAAALNLGDPGAPWHSDRSALARLAGWCAALTAATGKYATDLLHLTSTTVGEVALAATGTSSTMPQKANPVAPSALLALSRHAGTLAASATAAGMGQGQRDGAAWMGEWLTLPALVIATGRAAGLAGEIAEGLTPDTARMATNLLAAGPGLMAEAATFRLARDLPRDEATARVRDALAEARDIGDLETRLSLPPGSLAPSAHLGQAPALARAFAREVRA